MKTTWCVSFVLAVLVTVVAVGCSLMGARTREIQPRDLSPIESKFLSQEYRYTSRVSEIPPPLSTALFRFVDRMANPEERFNVSDAIVPSTPFTKISWVGMGNEFGFVLYKQGGLAPHHRLLLGEFKEDAVFSLALFSLPWDIDDMDQLRELVRLGKGIQVPDNKR